MNITLTNAQAAVLPTNIIFVDVLTLILNPENKSRFLIQFDKREEDRIHRKMELFVYHDHNGVLIYLMIGNTTHGMASTEGLNALFVGHQRVALPHRVNQRGDSGTILNIEKDTGPCIELIKQVIEHNTAYIVSNN